MTYPQPDSNFPAINGQNYFRLFTPLVSPGDIYQSEQGCWAIALGPKSDVARVTANYFDEELSPTFMNTVQISPERAITGLIAARNEATYMPSKRRGRVLFWSTDLYDPNYTPRGSSPNVDITVIEPPMLDLYQYFQPQESMSPRRDDREFYYQNLLFPSGVFYLVIPYYGRKYGFIECSNATGQALTIGIRGVNFAITNDSISPFHQETVLQAAGTAIVANVPFNKIITETDGLFDALVIGVDGVSGPSPLKIVTSDTLGG